MPPRVLIVDDEADVGRLLAFNLSEAGFETAIAGTGQEALTVVASFAPHVILLDLMLPDMSGYEVCRLIRANEHHGQTGVIMLTARGDEDDRVGGLEAGADDYVVKPFSVREVVLRVQALAKRAGERLGRPPTEPAMTIRLRQLEVTPRTHEVRFDGQVLSLRPLEFKLLVTLTSEPGRVFSREDLLTEVWGLEATANTRTVDVHIKRLRSNLLGAANMIETVHGFGYRAVRD